MSVHIRAFENDDAPALAHLRHASVRRIGLRDYSPAQVAAWSPAPRNPALYVRRGLEGRIFLVAVSSASEPIAYGDIEADGHIDDLYCRPDFVGTGVASALYDRLEAAASQLGLSRLHVEASEVAKPLFQRKGFSIQQRNDFYRHGVQIHNYTMTKMLATGGVSSQTP